jgi:hypothetical protein
MLKFEQIWDEAYLGAEGFSGEINDAPFIGYSEDFTLVIDSSGMQLDVYGENDLESNSTVYEMNYEAAKKLVNFLENLTPAGLYKFLGI